MEWVKNLEKKRSLLQRKEELYWTTRLISCSGNGKQLWKNLNTLLLRGSKLSSPTPIACSLTANALSQAFSDKVRSVRESTSTAPPPMLLPGQTSSMSVFETCSQEDVRKMILNSPVKACPQDPIPTFLLREFIDDLLPYITLLCQKSLKDGSVPISQKTAVVSPILKQVNLDPNECQNYRPISNLTFLSKLLERLVVQQLTGYLDRAGLMPVNQSAYRQYHSTETALLKVVSDVAEAMDVGKLTLMGMLDISAAFDTVDHVILRNRLATSYGLAGTVLDWITSFLNE